MHKGRTIRKVMGGSGGFLACQNFIFGPFPVQEFVFWLQPYA